MKSALKSHTLITGALLLTASGFACRFLGFFYRIFLSRTIGAEGLGLFGMMHPVFGICFALCSGSVQTAISQYVAAHVQKGRTVFQTGLVISLSMSAVLSLLITVFSDFLAGTVLLEPRLAPLLPLMALSVPFSAFHACINGYYYGMKKTKAPAFSQIAEQVVRMGAVFLLAGVWTAEGREITVALAVFGHLIGEAASCLYSITALCFFPPQKREETEKIRLFSAFPEIFGALMLLALPLMGNRLVLNLLSSSEAILIPNRLTVFGLTSEEAISVYGVLTGMALPFIFFPTAITNSMAVLLLPTVAQAQSAGEPEKISSTITTTLRCSLYMGILFIGLFILFGKQLGVGVFKSSQAGAFLQILAWLCPFLYLSTTMGSILNGLGKTSVTFFQNVFALSLRLCFVFFGIPRFGMTAYLWGILASELTLALTHLYSLKKAASFSWEPVGMIVKPALLLLISMGIYYWAAPLIPEISWLPPIVITGIHMTILSSVYAGLLLLFHKPKISQT